MLQLLLVSKDRIIICVCKYRGVCGGVCTCICMVRHICIHPYGSQRRRLGILLDHSPPKSLETMSLFEPGTSQACNQQSPSVSFVSTPRVLELQVCEQPSPAFYSESWSLNLSLPAYATSILTHRVISPTLNEEILVHYCRRSLLHSYYLCDPSIFVIVYGIRHNAKGCNIN